MNSVSALSVVEMIINPVLSRWVFHLYDEEGRQVYEGEFRLTKLDAMADRDSYHRKASETLPEYRTLEQKVSQRAYFRTREPQQ